MIIGGRGCAKMKSVNQHLVQTDGMFFLYGRKATDIMEMWMPYAEKLGKEYRFLIYAYPFYTTKADEQIDFAAKLLNVLSIKGESEEDQKRLADLFRKLDAEILNVPGGHVGFIVQSEYYIDLIEKFLKKNVS